MTRRQRQANLSAMLVGLIATAAVLATYALGGLDWLESKTYDLRVRYTNSIEASPDILCIDIDDDTLDTYGRWPWSRVLQAPLVSIPAELGATAILVDLTWNEAETLRLRSVEHADIMFDPVDMRDIDSADFELPDLALRAAIADAKNVYLAHDYAVQDLEHSDEFNRAVDALRRGEGDEVERLISALRARRERVGLKVWEEKEDRPHDRVRMVAALERHPTLDEGALGAQLEIKDREFLSDAFSTCQRAALRRILRGWFSEQPERWRGKPWDLFTELHELIAGGAYRGKTVLADALAEALDELLSYDATTRAVLFPLETVQAVAAEAEGLTPIRYLLADAARRSGFVAFHPDTDGVVRRLPLVAKHRGRVLVQIALALACDHLGVTADGVSGRPGRLTLRPADERVEPRVIQLDERGHALVPWLPEPQWVKQFTHIGADDVLTLHEHREYRAHNLLLVRGALKEILRNPLFEELAQDADVLEAVGKLEAQRQEARDRGQWQKARDVEEFLRSFESEVAEVEQRVQSRAAAVRDELQSSAESGGRDARAQFEGADEQLALIDRCHAANAKIQGVIDDYVRRLRGYIDGRICLIGYTATSLADMKPTPTHKSVPGVMAHANLLNGLLTGRLVGSAPAPMNVALAVVLGIGACFVSVWRPPRVALVIVLVAAALFVALAGWLAFYRWAYWVHLTPALGTMLVSFVAIAVYRYFFVDSERRHLATALGQYTSKSIAEKVAEDPELCRRAEMREVTAMFTDLKSFTTISERIGAERTQLVLNTCLGRFTDVMLRREAMINKFIGDGVFAFWNPVIYPQPDHAELACETAIDLLVALRELIEEQRQQGGDEAFGDLVLRIGLATGKSIVGPCGSEQKFDYTCIGDSVNVAARLESANKFYGTQILVNEDTRRAVGEQFAFRSLGGVRVKGKRQVVQIAELLGRAGQVDEGLLDYARAFGVGILLFQRREWAEVIEVFEGCAARRPEDSAAREYAAAAKAYQQEPPQPDWSGAIELTEK